MKRIGILGGSFDPIHKGHIALAKGALKHFNLDTVYFIPAGNPYHRNQGTQGSKEDRLAMVRLAVEKEKHFEVKSLEVDREGPSYTLDTIKALEEEAPDNQYFLILGSDAFLGINRWKGIEELAQRVTFIVAIRGGDDEWAWRLFLKELPGYLKEKTLLLPLKACMISASSIRKSGIRKSHKKITKGCL